MRIIRKQLTMRQIAVGVDEVAAFMPIAPGGTFHSLQGEVLLQASDVSKNSVGMYPAAVYAAQMVEIDDLVDTWDDLWDRYIPKDQDVSETAATYQLDAGRDTENQAPFEEPGEPSPNALFDMTEPTQLLFKREQLTAIGKQPVGFEGAAVDTYHLTESYGVSIRQNIRFPNGGFVALGISNPNFDDVTPTPPQAMASIFDVLRYEHLEDFLHTAKLALLGATETGAETPFVDTLSLIEELTEPTVFEITAGRFLNVAIDVMFRGKFEVSVRDSKVPATLRSD